MNKQIRMESSLRGPWRVGKCEEAEKYCCKSTKWNRNGKLCRRGKQLQSFFKKKKGAEGGTGKFSLWRALAKKFHCSKLPNSIFQFESKEQFSFVRFYSI